MKNFFEGYPSKKDFVTEGINGLFTGFISFPLFLFLMAAFFAVFGTLMMVTKGLIAGLEGSLNKPIELMVWIALIALFSVIPYIVLTDALKKKKTSFIIFYPIGLAISILSFYNLGTF
jgi:hypothetical protein